MSDYKNFYNNDSKKYYFESHYEDISEPLKEYNVGDDGSLYKTATSETLLGVKKNGKWGWVDANNMFVIQPMYDFGFVTCYNGIIVLTKNGLWGGVYRRDESIAFSFRYFHLSYAYRDTYVAWNDKERCALVKPIDRMLTSFKYKGISQYNKDNITEYLKCGIWGDVTGLIDLETGKEL